MSTTKRKRSPKKNRKSLKPLITKKFRPANLGFVLRCGSISFFGLVLIVLVIVLVKLLTDQRASNIVVRDLKDAVQQAEEDLAGADLLALLDQAREESDLRMMVRIRYLMLIQKLDDIGSITYRKDRSNWSYHAELVGQTQERFGRLTRIFDYIWYGNVQPTSADENQVAEEISSLMTDLGKKNEQFR